LTAIFNQISQIYTQKLILKKKISPEKKIPGEDEKHFWALTSDSDSSRPKSKSGFPDLNPEQALKI
jgi:hypothetical protein